MILLSKTETGELFVSIEGVLMLVPVNEHAIKIEEPWASTGRVEITRNEFIAQPTSWRGRLRTAWRLLKWCFQ